MHPDIRSFAGKQFYNDKIRDHESVLPYGENQRKTSYQLKIIEQALMGRHLLFLDLVNSSEDKAQGDRSKRNIFEAAFTQGVVKHLNRVTKTDLTKQIGVISPYKS